jgi:uncharacterized protein (DUF305 family)
MASNRIRQALPAMLCGVVAAAFVSACGSGEGTATHSDPAGTSHQADHGDHADQAPVITDAPAGFNDADVAFATNMIPHHQQAIELAGLVADRSTNPELIALSQRISAAQQPEVTTMNAFLVQWSGGAAAPTEHSGHAGMAGMVDGPTMARLATLNGAEFDTLWLQSMIGHHQGAIEMAETELATGTNADAKKLAQDIVTAQRAEIEQMDTMLAGNP